MIDEILVDTLPGETRIALLDAGRLVEAIFARAAAQSLVGAVFNARVTSVKRDQGAAFVDIGQAQHGYLSLRKGGKPPTQGAALLVQVAKDGVDGKGPGVTDRVALRGRYLSLLPWRAGIERARRLPPGAAKAAERALAPLQDAAGWIVHPQAEGAEESAIAAEAEALMKTWQAAPAGPRVPAALAPAPDPAVAAILGNATRLKRAVFEDAEALARARAALAGLAPDLVALLARHDGPGALFGVHETNAQIEAALEGRVRLPSGGMLTIDELAPLAVIDVDMARQAQGGAVAGAEAVLRLNLEAAREVARQVRLRSLGGVMVVDFVRMTNPADRKRVVEALRAACAHDPEQVDVLGMTPAGLVELTRRRGRPSLRHLMYDACGTCGGGGALRDAASVAYDLARAALRAAQSAPGKRWYAVVAPEVAAALEQDAATRALLDRRLGAFRVLPEAGRARDRFEVAEER